MHRFAGLDCAGLILLVLSTHASFWWIWLSDSVRYVYACVVLLDLNSQCVILLDLSAHELFCWTWVRMRHSAWPECPCVILLDLRAHTSFCWTWERTLHSAGLDCAMRRRHCAGLECTMCHSAGPECPCVILLDLRAHASFCWTWVRMGLSAGLECAYVILLDLSAHASFCLNCMCSACIMDFGALALFCRTWERMRYCWTWVGMSYSVRYVCLTWVAMRVRQSAWQKYQFCETTYSRLDNNLKLDWLHAFRRRRKAHIFKMAAPFRKNHLKLKLHVCMVAFLIVRFFEFDGWIFSTMVR